MNRKWLGVALLFLAATAAVAHEAFVRPDGAEDEIKMIEAQWAKAYVAKDAAFFQNNCSDDYTFVGPDGSMGGKKEDMEALKGGVLDFSSFEMSDLKIRLYGDAAVVTGKAAVKGKLAGNDVTGDYRFTDTFVKKDGKWWIVAGQATRMAGK